MSAVKCTTVKRPPMGWSLRDCCCERAFRIQFKLCNTSGPPCRVRMPSTSQGRQSTMNCGIDDTAHLKPVTGGTSVA